MVSARLLKNRHQPLQEVLWVARSLQKSQLSSSLTNAMHDMDAEIKMRSMEIWSTCLDRGDASGPFLLRALANVEGEVQNDRVPLGFAGINISELNVQNLILAFESLNFTV